MQKTWGWGRKEGWREGGGEKQREDGEAGREGWEQVGRERHGEGKWSRLAPSTGQLISTAPWLSPEPQTLASHVSREDRSDNDGSGDTQH